MRVYFLFLLTAFTLAGSGCTHKALQRNTIRQAGTLTDLQYQQVLDNLAMFTCNPDSLPWHLKLTDGLVQVTDQGGADVLGLFSWPTDIGSSLSPSVRAERGALGQWAGEPAIGSDDLELLALAYRKAVSPSDEENAVEIRFQIWKLVATYDLAPGSEVLLDIMNDSLDEEFKTLERRLNRARTTQTLTDVEHAIEYLREGYRNLKVMVDDERQGQPYKTPAEITRGVENLVTSDLQNAYDSLARALAEVEADEEARKVLMDTMRRVNLIRQSESRVRLADAIPRLNPAREAVRLADKSIPAFDNPKSNAETRFFLIVGNERYLFSQAKPKPDRRNPGLIDQAEEKLAALKELLEETDSGNSWFHVGGKKDVPSCACYVGHHTACGRDCYVWVTADQLKHLKDFTLKILALAPIKEQDLGADRGAAFSPGLR